MPQQTTIDLGQKVKAKYPGQYDDMPDHEVGRRVKAKFPGSYDDFAEIPGTERMGALPGAPKAPVPAALQQPDPVSIPLRNRDGVMTPKGLDKPESFIESVALAPVKMVSGGAEQLGRGTTRVANPKSGSDFAGGASDIIRGGMAMGLPAAVPAIVAAPGAAALGLGAGIAATAGTEGLMKAAGVPDGYAELAGDIAGFGTGTAAVTRGIPAMRRVAAKAQGEPLDLMVRALKPTSTNAGFSKSLNRSMPELKATEAELGKPITGVGDLLAAVGAAKKRVWQQYSSIAGPQAKRGIDLSPVADAMVATIPERTRLENPQAAAAIEATANKYRRAFPIEEAEGFLKSINADLDGYYAKYPTAQRVARDANPDTAALEAQARSIRDAIYRALDQPGEGAAPRELKQRYGALMNMEREAYRRQNVAARQQPESLSEQVGKWSAVGQAARGGMKLLGGDLGGAADIGGAIAQRKAATWLKEQQTTDAMIRRAFENYKGAPNPVQSPPPFRPAGLLTEGDIVTSPPPDSSFVRSVPAMPSVGNRPPRLNPPRNIVTPPPGDSSYVRAIPAEYPEVVGRPPALKPPDQR